MKKRLSKALAGVGIASRRASEEIIFAGRVTVNGEVVLLPQTLVDLKVDEIQVDGESVTKEEPKVYYLLNKPIGYICSSKSVESSKLVIDLFKEQGLRLFTIGRLDKNTEGLLLVTNDGIYANKVMHPSSNIQKEYLAKTDQDITHEQLKAISAGTLVEGVFIRPCKVAKVRRGVVKITVMEGKKHEVRMLLDAAGLKVLHLKRIRIGNLHLGNIPIGAYKTMTEKEKQLVFE